MIGQVWLVCCYDSRQHIVPGSMDRWMAMIDVDGNDMAKWPGIDNEHL